MELPIDHYRLLGVSPASDCQTVLRTLQHRLDHPPKQGFSHEALQSRAALLRSSADLLSDEDRRSAYEADLIAFEGSGGDGAPGLDVPSSKELGGLLLLLEAGQPLDSFEAARRSLQPPQTPALGSSRETDLTLLVGLSCRQASSDLRDQRHFEAAASLLQQGLQLLQRMGQAPEQRRQLDSDLHALLPFRVLDLLSRDLAASHERQEGLRLLEVLVKKRGGLEGDSDPELPRQDFQSFFKQIRQFLTVQEQVDLFGRWAGEGSPTAEFLTSYALTASGFSQRKPERIAAGLERLAASGQPGVGPFLACQHLLLGQVDTAHSHFEASAGEDLRRWAEAQGDDPLAQLCAYCRDWLSRDVLPGYRDIETDADLEAYFADRDVQAYVEKKDLAPAAWVPTALGQGVSAADWPALGESGNGESLTSVQPVEPFGSAELPAQPSPRRQGRGLPWLWPAGLGLATVAVAAGSWIAFRPLNPSPTAPSPSQAGSSAVKPDPAKPDPGKPDPSKPTPPPAVAALSLPLKAQAPSDAEIQGLLEAWLKTKAEVLDGKTPGRPPGELARPALVASLQAERRSHVARGERKQVKAEVEQLTVVSRSPRRIEINAQLGYSDQTTNLAGAVQQRTPAITVRNTYVFGRDGDTWRLAGWRQRS
ncbi:ARC6/PARC6 family protein [Synechococcus sp. CS-602]|uniref:IMS domain-containing protein n=1 Tax=Synechococcaceae TaxID=1890426 RepID=UPI0008FF7293|nr:MULTISPECIES: IMS domain-containing protein [Synechococcaceae]MCT4364113.1 ARC6/PARC6 family protein [Candidatus Regnicoccus frigidus MAG-AL1]APD48785.1 hypothetical protein BM449_11720 [Synechococcus sp. SynAce01]MCT0203908.1 ARC6/PARC6 family protein [Synechococcus sp. CS-602]MCT0245502.1 ARC6/PARC6 family protein [Synechococcus sp. CS-601]MCT4367278.1 ARC6/PARC6 family protein [Candidatus Regnicoccus frigidus MAG-AL2]